MCFNLILHTLITECKLQILNIKYLILQETKTKGNTVSPEVPPFSQAVQVFWKTEYWILNYACYMLKYKCNLRFWSKYKKLKLKGTLFPQRSPPLPFISSSASPLGLSQASLWMGEPRNLLNVTKILNAKYQMPNTKYKIQNTKYYLQNAKYQLQNTKYLLPYAKYKILTAMNF